MRVELFLCLLLVGGVVAPTAANALGVDTLGYTYDLEPHAARVAITSYDAASGLVVAATAIHEAALGVVRAPSADLRPALKATSYSYDQRHPLVTSKRSTTGGRSPPETVASEGSRGRSALNSRAGVAAKLAPGQIETNWGGLISYTHGGPMTAIEHINCRHAYGSGFSNVSKFSRAHQSETSRGTSTTLSATEPCPPTA